MIYTSFSKKVILDDLSNFNIDDIIKQLQEPMDCNFEQNIEVKSISEFNIENIFNIEELNPNDIDDLLSCQTPNDSETERNVSNGIVDDPKITKIEKPKDSKSKNVINARNYRRRQKESQKVLDQKCIEAQKLNEKLKLKVKLQSELLDKVKLWMEHL